MATSAIRQLGNMRGQALRNVGKPKEGTNALTWAIPSYTTTERDQIEAVNGMLIYDSTLNKIQGYQNGSWQNLI